MASLRPLTNFSLIKYKFLANLLLLIPLVKLIGTLHLLNTNNGIDCFQLTFITISQITRKKALQTQGNQCDAHSKYPLKNSYDLRKDCSSAAARGSSSFSVFTGGFFIEASAAEAAAVAASSVAAGRATSGRVPSSMGISGGRLS